jgi:hypothetical protein
LRIYEYLKVYQLSKMPLSFKRYIIVNRIRKKSHLELNTVKMENKVESPTRKFKRGDTVEM